VCVCDPPPPLSLKGDAWHYAYWVPHAIPALVALFPSPQAFDAQLNALMADSVPFTDKFGEASPNKVSPC
jgi:putative alpha-1,2-mannosidase